MDALPEILFSQETRVNCTPRECVALSQQRDGGEKKKEGFAFHRTTIYQNSELD